MDKNEKRIVDKIKNMITCNIENFEEAKFYISGNIEKISYTSVLSQKILLKVNLNSSYTDSQKEEIYDIFITYYKGEFVQNYIHFCKSMILIEREYISQIKNIIRTQFDSLFVFLNCLGKYIADNPYVIQYPKHLIIKTAMDTLDDGSWSSSLGKIVVDEATYINKLPYIEKMYKIGINCGCIKEKFDSISFGREEIVKVEYAATPFFQLHIKEIEWKYRLMYASAYYGTIFHDRYLDFEDFDDPLYNYYKCEICKKAKLLNIHPDIPQIMQALLQRQFAAETLLDYLVRHSGGIGNTATYVISIYLYVYIELLFTLLVYTNNYVVVTRTQLRKNMCGANYISDEEFDRVFNICFSLKNDNVLWGPYYRRGSDIIIGSWMFDSDYYLFEVVRNRVFNPKNDVRLGEEVGIFGKNVFENFIKKMALKCGWKTLNADIKIKSTDFDIVTFREGIVILAQVKVDHCDRTPYSIWKANEIIEAANRQIVKCRTAISEDRYLLYSNLKREKIVSSIKEIKEIVFLIISGNSYLAGDSDVPVISIEDWKNLLNMEPESDMFREFLSCPPSMYPLNTIPEYTESIIETDEFTILYDEVELND